MPDDAARLDAWMMEALRALDHDRVHAVLRDIARAVRKRNQARMTRQVAPDGTPWAPRKPQRTRHGAVRRKAKMMVKLRQARRLRITETADDQEIGWRGQAARIAAVHHFGRRDTVTDGIEAEYPARPLLGWSADDIAAVRARLLEHLSGGSTRA